MIASALLLWTLVPADLALRFVPEEPRLGDLLVVYVDNADAKVTEGVVTVFEHEQVLQRVDPRRLRAMVAVPIDIAPGRYPIAVDLEGAPADGEVVVVDRPWAESVLRVSKKFTEKPNAQLKARLAAEERAWGALFRHDPQVPAFVGGWIKPVDSATTSPFGQKRMFNGQLKTRHYGLDLDGDVGDPIVAGQAGFIAMSADRFTSGGTVVIDHGNGLFSAYFHFSRRDKEVGERVRAGERIGLMGATGRVTGPHLHLSMMVQTGIKDQNGKVSRVGLFVDPERALELILEGDRGYLAQAGK